MVWPILAGVLVGGTLFYASRLIPRIIRRANAAGAAAFRSTAPYAPFEYGFQSTMSEREAYLLLGFPEKQAGAAFTRPSEEDVKKQYREIMKDFHSDINGTPYLATKLNEAKDILIK